MELRQRCNGGVKLLLISIWFFIITNKSYSGLFFINNVSEFCTNINTMFVNFMLNFLAVRIALTVL